METASNENTLQSVDANEHHPVDQQHPVEQEHPVDQQHLVDQEHSVDEVLSVDQEHSFDRERSVDQELSVDKEHSVEQERLVDKEHSVEQEHLVDKEHLVEQEHLVDKEHSVEQEHLVDKEHSVDQEHLVDHNQDNMVADVSNHGVSEPNPDFNEEEVRCTLEAIASTGKFWHDWDKLKSMLSFQLKQVLSEYPESKMTSEQQTASIGETYPELLKKLDDALLSFVEGPPFTLQRLCEILLAARSIYPNLSKLALALEKNFSVTSTLTVCTDPYPQTPNEAEKPSELQLQSNSVENGVEPIVEDRDEVMTEVEQGDIDDEMTIDMEALEEIVGSSETNATPTANS